MGGLPKRNHNLLIGSRSGRRGGSLLMEAQASGNTSAAPTVQAATLPGPSNRVSNNWLIRGTMRNGFHRHRRPPHPRERAPGRFATTGVAAGACVGRAVFPAACCGEIL